MKKFTQIFFLLLMAASVAFAQQAKDLNASKAVKKSTHLVKSGSSATVASVNESFEGVFPPTGWVTYSPDNGTGWTTDTVGTGPIFGWQGGLCTATPNGLGGNYMAFCTWSTGGLTSNDQWLVTPQITIQNGYTLSFWLRKFSDLYTDTMGIMVSTTNNQMASFTEIHELGVAPTDTAWDNHTYSLNAYAGQSIYLAFREHVVDNYNDGAAFFLDLVRVDMGVGINNTEAKTGFRIYPNPVKDMMTVESQDMINKVTVSNILGAQVASLNANGQKIQINTSDFQPGVYFVNISTDKGTTTRKINITR